MGKHERDSRAAEFSSPIYIDVEGVEDWGDVENECVGSAGLAQTRTWFPQNARRVKGKSGAGMWE